MRKHDDRRLREPKLSCSKHAAVTGDENAVLPNENGVQKPINVVEGESDRPMVTEGHHRVFSAADIDPDMEIPVWWDKGSRG